jgi:CubicO group peptidase (beta-lactamase class C family)
MGETGDADARRFSSVPEECTGGYGMRGGKVLRGFSWLVLAAFGTTGSAAAGNTSISTDSLAARIARIEDNLTPLVIIKGRQREGLSLAERMEYYSVPGVSIAVIDDGRLEWAKGYGVADRRTGRTVDESTIFQAASISKPVAAVAAMRLVESGRLDLDSVCNKYLSSWRIPDNEFTESRKVTLRQLMSHSAGLPEEACPGYSPGEPVPTLLQVLDGTGPAKTGPVRVERPPGAEWKYSNGGYCVIQLILLDQLGKSFADIMQELVLAPAGMNESTFRQQLPEGFSNHAATGYNSTGEDLEGGWNTYPESASAGLWTTPSDLCRFTMAIMRSYDGVEDGLIGQSAAREMLRVQAGSYGLGFELDDEGEDFSFSHGGASSGYRCYLLAYPQRNQGAVIMTNSDSGDGLYYEILRTLANEYAWPGYRPIEKEIMPLDEDAMSDFAGDYLLGDKIVLKIYVEEDHLRMDAPSNSYRLYPESASKFFDINSGFTMEFVRDSSGIVNEIVLDRGGVVSTLARIEDGKPR